MARPTVAPSDLAGEIGAQLSRRRAAALRLEPMSCGHRDELDCLAAEPMAAEISYCCASLGLEQSAALARMGRHCSRMSCARLPAAS